MTPELTKNLEILSVRFPEIIEELKAHVHTPIGSEQFNQVMTAIYGSHKVDDLLDRWAKHAPKERLRIVTTTGYGNGSHVRKLLNTIDQTSRVCVVECNVAALLHHLTQTDDSDLLSDSRFILLTPFCYREVITRLNIEIIGIESTSTLIYAPVYNLTPDLYKNVLTTVHRQLTTRWNQIKTDVENSEIIFDNSLQNLKNIGLENEIHHFYNRFTGVPLILVGAGPSLDDSFDFLKAAQGKAIIAVVNSAYRSVRNQGIVPDVTIAVDPKEGTFKGYEGTDTKDIPLICSFLVYPEVPKLFSNIIPLASHNFIMTILRKVMQRPEEPGIIGDGTVSSTVANLGFYFGCHEIYLVGQDMAIRTTGQSHTKDSFYTDLNQNHQDLSNCDWLEGNSGEKVPVEPKLHAYLKIFENQVSQMSSINFYNLAKHGAKVHGAKFIELDEAIKKVSNYPDANYRKLFLETIAENRLPEQITKAGIIFFQKYRQFLESILKPMMKFSVWGEMTPELNGLTLPELAQKKSKIILAYDEIITLIEKNPLFMSLTVEGRSKIEYHDFISSGEPWQLITNKKASLQEVLQHSWALVEGILFQIEVIERYFPEEDNLQ